MPAQGNALGAGTRDDACPVSAEHGVQSQRYRSSFAIEAGSLSLLRPFRALLIRVICLFPGRCPGLICDCPFGTKTHRRNALGAGLTTPPMAGPEVSRHPGPCIGNCRTPVSRHDPCDFSDATRAISHVTPDRDPANSAHSFARWKNPLPDVRHPAAHIPRRGMG